MQYRQLGSSDLNVSEIALGSWLTYGVSVEREATEACVKTAFDVGINFFDTANMYGLGAAEEVLGEILSQYKREEFVLATKVYFPMSETDKGLSREQIHKQIDASLKRLQTDYVDLYQCHRYDYDTPLEETMEALTEVVQAGKARYIGFSEWSASRIRSAAELKNVTPFVSSQPQYSMLYRKPEREVFPTCEELGISQIVWSPLAQGVLTGKYQPNQPPPENSRAAGKKISRFTDEASLRSVQNLLPIAERLSLTLPQLALSWILRRKEVSSAIIGAKRPGQILENIGCIGQQIDEESLQEIENIVQDIVRE